MNYNETIQTLNEFYEDCLKFWKKEGKGAEHAIRDIEFLEHDPFSPSGKKLDTKAKSDFINQKRNSLGL